jgi:hypothetical protein
MSLVEAGQVSKCESILSWVPASFVSECESIPSWVPAPLVSECENIPSSRDPIFGRFRAADYRNAKMS